MEPEVRDNPTQSRFELVVDDEVVALADYRVHGDRIVIPHTEVDPRHRGKGYGTTLVRGALDEIRGSGRAVVPACPFVRDFIDDHDEYRDLLAA